ncbi:hypothetical protein [Cohnella soli]|uniref:Pilus assembly protein n=1 Tax=Cohnella soli TaxID=425005 RepID=A0ABW0HSR3_9BACL
MFLRILRKRYPGIITADIALSPLAILAIGVTVTLFLMVIYYGLSYLFFGQVIMQGSRLGSVNPNVTAVHSAIYNGVTKVLPEVKNGATLITPTDIVVNANDGDYVTVTGKYKVLLPGVNFYENLGGSAVDWVLPIRAKFSFYREY